MNLKRSISGIMVVLLLLTFSSCKKTKKDSDGSLDNDSNITSDSYSNQENNSDSSELEVGSNGSSSNNKNTTSSKINATTTSPTNKMDFSKLKGTTVRIHIGGDPTNKDKQIASEFEAKYKCKVKYDIISWTEFQTKLVQMVNSEDPMDYIKLSDQEFVNYASKGLIQSINPYIDINNKYFCKSFMDKFKWKNNYYIMYDSANFISSYGFIFYNKTMFEDEGQTEPYTYYKQGKWTFDQFRKTAKAMTKDTNKDGKTDIYGFGTWWYEAFLLANGNSVVNLNNNGNIDVTLQNKNAYTAMQLIEDMQLVDHSYDWTVNANDKFLNSQMAMLFERPWEAVGAYNMYDKDNFPDELGICPIPKGPDTGNKTYAPTIIYGNGIPKGAKNPLGAVAWYLFTAERNEKHINDSDVVKQRKRTLSEEHNKIVQDYIKNSTPLNSFANGIGSWYTSKWDLWAGILRDNVPPATTVAENINILKNEIKRTLDSKSTGAIND